jgi:hypothetical protein
MPQVLILLLHASIHLIVRAVHMTKTVPKADAPERAMTNLSLPQ